MFRALAVTAAIAALSPMAPQAAAQSLHADPTLIPESPVARPGQTLWIALDFELDEDWHTYWPGVNDTGMALGAEIECSAQAEPGELLWPAPHRYSPSEGILDHIFEEHMTVLMPLQISADAKLGDSVTLTLDMNWLVCKSACVLESAERSLTIPIAEAAAKPSPETAAVFARARDRLPQPITDRDPIRISGTGSRLTIQSNGASAVAFYPNEECRPTRDLLKQGFSESDTLVVDFADNDHPIRGVLEIWSTPTESKVFEIAWPPAAKGRPNPAVTDRRSDR